MGDGVQNRFALIINADTDPKTALKHQRNVEAAIRMLQSESNSSFKVFVANPQSPSGSITQYEAPNEGGLQKLIKGIKDQKIDDDDLLVVYFTGHGNKDKQDRECAELSNTCLSLSGLSKKLQDIPYGKRFVLMDLCKSGGGLPLFANSKTAVITAGSANENVICELFSPYFLSEQIPGAGKVISIEERFAYAQRVGNPPNLPQIFNPFLPISLSGKLDTPPFPPDVITVHNGKALEKQLKKLQPGQLALVMFSADWCGACDLYRQDTFDKLAKQYNGKFLMIEAEGINGSEQDWEKYNIGDSIPKVAFIDHRGKVTLVANRDDPLASLVLTTNLTLDEQISFYLQKLSSTDPLERRNGAQGLANFGNLSSKPVKPLIKLLEDPDWKVRWTAIYALGAFGGKAYPAVPTLLKFLGSRYSEKIVLTGDTLLRIGVERPEVFSILADVVSGKKVIEGLEANNNKYGNTTSRIAAALLLSGLVKYPDQFPNPVPTLKKVAQDSKEDPQLRKTAALSLDDILEKLPPDKKDPTAILIAKKVLSEFKDLEVHLGNRSTPDHDSNPPPLPDVTISIPRFVPTSSPERRINLKIQENEKTGLSLPLSLGMKYISIHQDEKKATGYGPNLGIGLGYLGRTESENLIGGGGVSFGYTFGDIDRENTTGIQPGNLHLLDVGAWGELVWDWGDNIGILIQPTLGLRHAIGYDYEDTSFWLGGNGGLALFKGSYNFLAQLQVEPGDLNWFNLGGVMQIDLPQAF